MDLRLYLVWSEVYLTYIFVSKLTSYPYNSFPIVFNTFNYIPNAFVSVTMLSILFCWSIYFDILSTPI